MTKYLKYQKCCGLERYICFGKNDAPELPTDHKGRRNGCCDTPIRPTKLYPRIEWLIMSRNNTHGEAMLLRAEPPLAAELIEGWMTVADVGCYGWRLADCCKKAGAILVGVDTVEPPNRPSFASYAEAKNGRIDLPEGIADMVVASHVLEHITEPVKFFLEITRITRPGGLLWLESPSEMSAQTIGTSDAQDHTFESFWDDPTHVRPWTPASLYRLSLSCGCVPEAIGRTDAEGIPSVRMVARKPQDWLRRGKPRYVSLRGVQGGVESAWNHVWGSN